MISIETECIQGIRLRILETGVWGLDHVRIFIVEGGRSLDCWLVENLPYESPINTLLHNIF